MTSSRMFNFLKPLSIATVTLTQLISTVKLFWGGPLLPHPVQTSFVHVPLTEFQLALFS